MKNAFLLFKIKHQTALAAVLLMCLVMIAPASAAPAPNMPSLPIPAINVAVGAADSPQDLALTIQIIALITVLSMAPAILLMLTSFTRILVVLGFIRGAIGLQQTPPNQVVASMALFLTIFTMGPVWNEVYSSAVAPYMQEEIPVQTALERTMGPIRQFMFRQTRERELSLMLRLSGEGQPAGQDDVPTMTLIPAFFLSELKTAFQMGIVIYIPFIVVDMIVASILMSMGMMMLPPSMISLPFKILLFVMADGWNLIVSSLVTSFN